MIHVIQIFKSFSRIEKPEYNHEKREKINNWNNTISSKNGYYENGIIHLPIHLQNKIGLKTEKLIIIQDVKNIDLPKLLPAHKSFESFKTISKKCNFEIFKFRENENQLLDIELDYSNNEFYIGIPKRNDHKIAELKLNSPIRYQLNGKSDFTMSGRKQRTFTEYDYVIQYLGKAEKIKFEAFNKIEKIKEIPHYKSRLIDERKFLN